MWFTSKCCLASLITDVPYWHLISRCASWNLLYSSCRRVAIIGKGDPYIMSVETMMFDTSMWLGKGDPYIMSVKTMTSDTSMWLTQWSPRMLYLSMSNNTLQVLTSWSSFRNTIEHRRYRSFQTKTCFLDAYDDGFCISPVGNGHDILYRITWCILVPRSSNHPFWELFPRFAQWIVLYSSRKEWPLLQRWFVANERRNNNILLWPMLRH